MQDFEQSVAKDAMVGTAAASAAWLRVLDGSEVLGWISTAAVTGPMRAADVIKSVDSVVPVRGIDQARATLHRLRGDSATRSIAVLLWPTDPIAAPPCPQCHMASHPGEPCRI